MMNPFLTPIRRIMELVVAGFGAGMGAYILVHVSLGINLFRWIPLNMGEAIILGQTMVFAGLLHAAGIQINGRWRWSPFMRLIGMLLHLMVIGLLSWFAAGTLEGFTYPYILAGFVAVTGIITRDCVIAVRKGRVTWSRG